MAGQLQWYGDSYSCPQDPSKNHERGWYYNGQYTGITDYINPATGKAYTIADFSGGNPSQGGGSSSTENWPYQAEQQYHHRIPTTQLGQSGMPSFGDVAGNVPAPPQYETPAQLEEMQDLIGGEITNIIEEGGLGLPEETKEDIFLKNAEIINANTSQAMKNLEDSMAARGMSNSGMAFSEGMKLQSQKAIAMANVARDVEIEDAYMKLASYANALSMGVQFMSYMSDEAWKQYQPKLMQWQAQVDMYMNAINQAYAQNNMALAHQYSMELAQFEANTQTQLVRMQIDAAAEAASKDRFWDILGTGLGLLASIFAL